MKSGISIGFLSLAIALAASTATSPALAAGTGLKPLPKAEHCQANVSTYNYRKSDPEFAQVASDLNREFIRNVDVRSSVKIAGEKRSIVPADAETIRIQVETVQCAANKRSAGQFMTTQCNYVGCIGDLGPDYQGLPQGSQVSIGVCGGGVQTVSNYTMNSQGQWVMTGYRTEQVDQCSPMG